MLPESILPSQNLPRPPRIYALSLDMRPSHNLPIPPEYLLLSHYMQRSHNLPLPPRMYPPIKHLHATLTEFTFRPNIYPHFNHLRPSQNLPLPPRIGYPPFLSTICDTSIINPSLPEYTLFYIKCGSQNRPHLSRIYPPFLQLYAMLPESTPPSQNIPPPPPLRNATLPEFTHPSRISSSPLYATLP